MGLPPVAAPRCVQGLVARASATFQILGRNRFQNKFDAIDIERAALAHPRERGLAARFLWGWSPPFVAAVSAPDFLDI